MGWINELSFIFINNIKLNNNYRNFKRLQNIEPPYSIYNNRKIINWSNNDYNGLTHNFDIKQSLLSGINKYGCGSSGTRNIGGTNNIHDILESKICDLHNKDSGLIFGSGYLANLSCMQALGKIFPNAEIFSDEYNHSSIIDGIKLSNLNKNIFNHNDCNHLELLLKKKHSIKEKIIVIESIYSIDGSIAPFKDIIKLSKKYNALIYVDEIHGVGVHGAKGGGITDMLNITDDIDIIMGGFGKGYGLIGGYLTGNKYLIDSIRLCGSGFIFTTSLPPHIVSGIIKSIDIIRNSIENIQQNRKDLIEYFQYSAKIRNIPIIETNFKESQIQSIHIGCPLKAETIHNTLLNDNHYVQHLNYPTVNRGSERLRLSIKKDHNKEMISNFLDKLENIID